MWSELGLNKRAYPHHQTSEFRRAYQTCPVAAQLILQLEPHMSPGPACLIRVWKLREGRLHTCVKRDLQLTYATACGL